VRLRGSFCPKFPSEFHAAPSDTYTPMFEKLVLRRSEGGPALTLGDIAEALLFYGRTHLILDYGTLGDLVSRIGLEGLLRILEVPGTTAVYCEETLGASTYRTGGLETFGLVAFKLSGHVHAGRFRSTEDQLLHLLKQKGYTAQRALPLIRKFIARAPRKRYSSNDFTPGGVVEAAFTDLADDGYVRFAAEQVLFAGSDAPAFEFRMRPLGSKLYEVITDIDFRKLSLRRGLVLPDELTPANVLTEILSARADIALAAHYGSDFRTASVSSRLIVRRTSDLLRRSEIDAQQLADLRNLTLADVPSLREVMDSGSRSLDDFIKVLERATRFRHWLHDIDPDEQVVAAYLREVTAEGWINAVPTKVLRYVAGLAVESLNPVVGSLYSAADALLVERLFGGWRPSHFIDKRLRPFVSQD
jgi:hypothetical protein